MTDDAKIENSLLVVMYSMQNTLSIRIPVEDTKVRELIKHDTSRSDSNQKSRCFLYPSSREMRRLTKPTAAKTASIWHDPRRDEGGRRRSLVTSLNQRMDELCFLLAIPKVERVEVRTLTNVQQTPSEIKSCPVLGLRNLPFF